MALSIRIGNMEDLQALFDELKAAPLVSTVAKSDAVKRVPETEGEPETTTGKNKELRADSPSRPVNSNPKSHEGKVLMRRNKVDSHANTNGEHIDKDTATDFKIRKCKVLVQRMDLHKYMEKHCANAKVPSECTTNVEFATPQYKKRGRKPAAAKRPLDSPTEITPKRARRMPAPPVFGSKLTSEPSKRKYQQSPRMYQKRLEKVYGRRFFRSYVKIKRMHEPQCFQDEKSTNDATAPSLALASTSATTSTTASLPASGSVSGSTPALAVTSATPPTSPTASASPLKNRSVSFKQNVIILSNEIVTAPNNLQARFQNLLEDDDEEFRAAPSPMNSTEIDTDAIESNATPIAEHDNKAAAFRLSQQLKIKSANEALKCLKESSPLATDSNTDTNGSFNEELLAIPKSDIAKRTSVSFSNIIEVFEVKTGANQDSPDNTSSLMLSAISPVEKASGTLGKDEDHTDNDDGTPSTNTTVAIDDLHVLDSTGVSKPTAVDIAQRGKDKPDKGTNATQDATNEAVLNLFDDDTDDIEVPRERILEAIDNPLLRDVEDVGGTGTVEDNSLSGKETEESGTPLSIKANNSNSSDSFVSAVDKGEIESEKKISSLDADSNEAILLTCPDSATDKTAPKHGQLEEHIERLMVEEDDEVERVDKSPLSQPNTATEKTASNSDKDTIKADNDVNKIAASASVRSETVPKRNREVTYALDDDLSLEIFATVDTEPVCRYVTVESSERPNQISEVNSDDFVLQQDSEASDDKSETRV